MSAYKPVGRTEVARLEKALQALFDRYDEFVRDPNSELELRADLAKFVCVRICGYVEQSLVALTTSHADSQSAPTVARFAISWLSRTQNPKRGTLVEFASRFDHGWGDELNGLFETIDPADTFNSLVQTRNDIAHGLSTGIGRDTLIQHLSVAIAIVSWFTDKLDPLPARRRAR